MMVITQDDAKYFSVVKIERDQVENDAQRKGMDLAEAERRLAHMLNYDPEWESDMAQAMTVRPAATDAPPKISYEDFLVQYEGIRAEWVDGEVELKMSVSDIHQEISIFLLRLMTEFVEAFDLGRVFQLEFQMKLVRERRGREPDLFFVQRSRLDRLQRNHFDGPGDLVIEIVSTDSIRRDYEDKFKEYQSGGVLEYWLIDPLSQQVNFFQRDASGLFQSVPANADGIYYSTGLLGFWVREEWFWQSPAPSMSAMRKEFELP